MNRFWHNPRPTRITCFNSTPRCVPGRPFDGRGRSAHNTARHVPPAVRVTRTVGPTSRGPSPLGGATMRTLALVCLLAATAAVPAQPAKNNTPTSPEVHPDRKVTFRVRAPKATEVTLTADWQAG